MVLRKISQPQAYDLQINEEEGNELSVSKLCFSALDIYPVQCMVYCTFSA